jgi:hypothetical protein
MHRAPTVGPVTLHHCFKSARAGFVDQVEAALDVIKPSIDVVRNNQE